MYIKNASPEDFPIAFDYIEKIWTYNDYDRQQTQKVYEHILQKEDTFAFFLMDDQDTPHGFCHGDFFDTFWMSGETCYVSSLMTNADDRGKGYGIQLMDHVKELAKERGCKALILDSGLPRIQAHKFYETYGFEKSCYGFELIL